VVPGLFFGAGVDFLKAVGISLISAETFGMMTAATYMWRGFAEPVLSMLYLVGGTAGGYISARIAY
jgi:uncharacterized membrane protein YfcA